MKKLIALVLALAMVLALTACGGGGGAAADNGNGITIFNTKSEIQAQMEEMAAEYTELTGVPVEVYYSNDTVAAHMATKYASSDPYTIAMVDDKDIYSLGPDHAIDLSGEPWTANTSAGISVDGKLLGIPFCVEARGVIYNAEAIEAITGAPFDPASVNTLDAFVALLDQLVAGGMESPVGIMKEDWSCGAHYLCEVYEQRDDVDGFIADMKAGNVDLMSDAKFNSMMDTFDVLKEYNYAKASPIAAEREVTEQKLAQGEIAFMFGGNWDWAVLNAYDPSDNMGIMPVPQNMDDGSTSKLVGGGSKFFFIDNTASEEQQQAAKDFLAWLFTDPAGNEFLTVDCALVPAFSNIEATNLDPLGASVKAYADADALIPNYSYNPDDHYAKMGAEMQKYLADQCTREQLASAIEAYWASVE